MAVLKHHLYAGLLLHMGFLRLSIQSFKRFARTLKTFENLFQSDLRDPSPLFFFHKKLAKMKVAPFKLSETTDKNFFI